MRLAFREDDLSGGEVRELLRLHLTAMHENSPPGSVFALDLSGLAHPSVTVWGAWADKALAGMGALKTLGTGHGEIKSMRTHPQYLRMGVAAALLEHIVAQARAREIKQISLETGSGPAFEPAIALYRRRGFVEGEPFADYARSGFNRFFHLELAD